MTRFRVAADDSHLIHAAPTHADGLPKGGSYPLFHKWSAIGYDSIEVYTPDYNHDRAALSLISAGKHMNHCHQKRGVAKNVLALACLLAFIATSLSTQANAGIRGPGKYSGVVIFDRWGGCILFSGVYLMYISETVKDQLRAYDGQAIELDAIEVVQPTNPGDGLIRKLKVLGPAQPNSTPFTFEGIRLDAQPLSAGGSHAAIELTVTNEGDTLAKIDSSQIGFVLLSERIDGDSTPSDGPSTAVITRTNAFTGKGTWGIGDQQYSYRIPDGLRFPQSFNLAPHTSHNTQLRFELPAGHYQFFAGYGGGVHESKLNVSNPVSIELW